MKLIDDLNTRQKQAYAAICLWSYCQHFDIKHSYIDELIQHLMTILSMKSLADWEQIGCKIAFPGRGDLLPDELYKIIPIELSDNFRILVDYCTEVGLINMYAASTDEPKLLLNTCIDLLENAKVKIPQLEKLHSYKVGSHSWGDTIREDELLEILEFYEIKFNTI